MDRQLSQRERRLAYEWDRIHKLVTEFPDRLSGLQHIDDEAFLVSVAGMPALAEQPGDHWQPAIKDRHIVTIAFPRYYPALPCEVFLKEPVFHPNIDKINGFVCLWSRHRVANTAADALSKLAAVLSWRLYNADAPHLMQPEALAWYQSSEEVRSRLPLAREPWIEVSETWESISLPHRRRLS